MSDNIPSNVNIYIPSLKEKKSPLDWYQLDNAATIFSLINSKRSTNVFRVSCTLKNPINHDEMQFSLTRVIERFPYFDVSLRDGFFWSYWIRNNDWPKIEPETQFPCQQINIWSKGTFPFRVKIYENRVAIEFHHSITDGYGGITFLKALIADYLSIKGIKPSNWGDVFHYEQTPNPREYEYSYRSNYLKGLPMPRINKRGFKPPLTKVKKGEFHLISSTISVKEILEVARDKKVSITELLTAVYLEALQEVAFTIPEHKRKRYFKEIRIAVPVDLRNLYQSKTMRNFAFMLNPEIDPRLGKYSFDEILSSVHHSLRHDNSKRYLNQYISRNVSGELYPIVRFIPLFLKRIFGQFIYKRMGEAQNSGKLSNLGKITMPNEFANEIENFEFILAPSDTITTGCAVISFQDKFTINFSRTVEEPLVEKYFFERLLKLGIQVKN
ncbi:MAG TPA: hypothetical protein VMZ29_15655 [Candidatus Bathyarchaeia archaeon]|nr:hypothetical protein [Candidatus Bathyarchaeia archaeon]